MAKHFAFGVWLPEGFPKGQEVKAASIGGLCNSSLTAAFLALCRIDFAARLHWLHYHWIAGAVACRTFNLSRFCVGGLFHFGLSGRSDRTYPLRSTLGTFWNISCLVT